MRLCSFLFVSILCLNFCDAYTVILVSGKQLNGTLLGEDSATIQLRDASGVVLSIKKSCVDLDATLRANTLIRPLQPAITANAPAPVPQKSLAEIARELRAARSGNSKLYTKEDLNYVPEISTSSAGISPVGNAGVSPAPESGSASVSPVPDESYWRKTAASFRKELARLRERKISAEFSCEKAREKRSTQIYGGNRRPSSLSQAFEQPSECKRFEEIQSQLSDALRRWDEFTERARKSGVPWSWIE